MFGISMWELSLILIVALIVLGPKQLTETARVIGKFYREAQKMIWDVRNSIDLDITSPTPKQEPPKPIPPPTQVVNGPNLFPSKEKSGPDFYADLLAKADEPEQPDAAKEGEKPASETTAGEKPAAKDKDAKSTS